MLLNSSKPAEVHAVRVSSNFLKTFGVHPELGRDFTQKEELPNGPKAVLLSDRLWRSRFHANRNWIGQRITLDGQPYTVAGILPASFIYPIDVKVDVMTTLPVSPTANHHDKFMSMWAVYGRLKPGVTIAQARADLESLFARGKLDIPLMFRNDTSLVVQPLQEHRVGNAQTLLNILIGAVTCLLLIACVNVSNLLLARWSARSGEFAVRAAIGAGRRRLARQLLTEAGLLTLLGCALGAALIVIMIRGFVRYAAGELPRLDEIAIDPRVFGIGVLVAILTTLIFAGLPVLRVGRINIQAAIQAPGRPGMTAAYRFAKRALVAAEVALSLILLCSASLLLQTLWHLENDRLGFNPEHVLSVSIPLKGTMLESMNRDSLISELVDFMRYIPGTEDAAQTECTPLTGGPLTSTFSRSDRPLPEAFHRGYNVHVCGAGPGYPKASGIRVLRGRFFNSEDFRYPNTLAVINETMAHTYFPGEDPIGKQILKNPETHQWKTVIGIVSDTKNRGLDALPAPEVLINGLTRWPAVTSLQFIVRSIGDQHALESALTAKLRSLDSGVIANFETLDQAITEMTAGPRFNSILLAGFAAIAFLMAIVGVYGVLSFAVAQRTQEIGVRITLGAAPGRILALVLSEGITLAFAGVVAGLSAVLLLTRYLKAMLYGVSATDPLTLLAVSLVLIVAAVIAVCLPAHRAASVDPMVALRHN